MIFELECHGCGEQFTAKSSRAKWCSAGCKKRHQRKPVEEKQLGADELGDSSKDSDLVLAVRKQLVAADRHETVEGQTAILLAKQASQAGQTGISALIKEMRVAVDEALEGAIQDIVCVHCGKQAMRPDPDDQVSAARRKRESKARQAAAGRA